MKAWLQPQINFVRAHLQIDMDASALARMFMVPVPEIWQLARAAKMNRNWKMSITGLHSPGGGNSAASNWFRPRFKLHPTNAANDKAATGIRKPP